MTNNSQTILLEDLEYTRLSSFIMSQFGIKLPPNKKTLLQCRLQKRLKILNYTSFKEYVDYVFSTKGLNEEVVNMIDAVSTNKTDFFREPVHFEFLMNQGIGEYLEKTGKNKLMIWSAGCSSGEEPYSIAMVLKEYISNNHLTDFSIIATDISESVLNHALVGIYTEEKARFIPYEYKKKYLLKGKNEYKDKVRINSELRSKIDFRMYNLLTTDYKALGKFDFIFCRNVMIYFPRDIQYRLLKQFCKSLNTGGYLFLGHSESITGYTLPLKHIRPTIFLKTNENYG
jgi:chemotaxis protein methyltransferase CheR